MTATRITEAPGAPVALTSTYVAASVGLRPRDLRVTRKCVSKRNITLALDEDLLQDARVIAAEKGLSVSALLRVQLKQLVDKERGYAAAKAAAVARLRRGSSLGSEKLPAREDLHDRAKLR